MKTMNYVLKLGIELVFYHKIETLFFYFRLKH
jgi:hypothetical protein